VKTRAVARDADARQSGTHLLVRHRRVPQPADEVRDHGHQRRMQARERARVRIAAAGVLGGRVPHLLMCGREVRRARGAVCVPRVCRMRACV
jgi:hypothetical protein